jgi:3-hydroxyacyl-[acyl-carrier-protein] dehydratase
VNSSLSELAVPAPLRAVDGVRVEHGPDGPVLYAHKAITATDPYLVGHFPAVTIYPGVFIVESVRQAVLYGFGESLGPALELTAVRSARFVAALVPGDELEITAGVELDLPMVVVKATCLRRGERVATVVAEFHSGGVDA